MSICFHCYLSEKVLLCKKYIAMIHEFTFTELRQEAKKLSVPLYSRKTKSVLVELILKYQKKVLIKDQTNENIISDAHSKLKRILSKVIPFLWNKSFPDKKITVTDNKDGSQTILMR